MKTRQPARLCATCGMPTYGAACWRDAHNLASLLAIDEVYRADQALVDTERKRLDQHIRKLRRALNLRRNRK